MLLLLRRLLAGTAPLSTGTWGERVAADWLRRHRGFVIVTRNWRRPGDRRDEIDLVAMDGSVLVFVEVKTRRASARVSGFHAVNRRKRAALRRACDAYLRSLAPSRRPQHFRFDVVEVRAGEAGEDAAAISHFEHVPLFRRYYRR